MPFADLGLSPDTLRALEDVGYTQPTPIQAMAIPLVLQHRDVLGIAQTGTGKTASFTLPMIEILSSGRAKARMPRSLILAPTRELASQVADNAALYSKYHKLSMALLIGGESMGDQQKLLDKGVDILIATPGRLLDLFDRGAILLRDVKMLVIDEADRMLDMGFIPDVEKIVSLLPGKRQTLFFSATMDKEIRRLADAFLTLPEEIRVEPTQKTAELVEQGLVIVQPNDKREALRHLLRREAVTNAFIFCNRKRDVDILFRSLSKHGFDVIALHGDMPQYVRTERLEKFKNGEVSLLVCSDVAARGIDISDVSHVFNFDVPIHSEDYVHRIGRTGRAGRKGSAFTIATRGDQKHLAAIETLLGKEIPRVILEGLDEVDLTEDDADHQGKGRSARGRKREKTDTRRPAASSPAKEDRRTQEPASAGNGRNGRSGKGNRWRDGPQADVMDMPIDDNAIGFGGFTPAFILEAVVVPFIESSSDPADDALDVETDEENDAAPKKAGTSRRRGGASRRKRRSSTADDGAPDAASPTLENGSPAVEETSATPEGLSATPEAISVTPEETSATSQMSDNRGSTDGTGAEEAQSPTPDAEEKPKRRRASPRRKKVVEDVSASPDDGAGAVDAADRQVADEPPVTPEAPAPEKKKATRTRRTAVKDGDAEAKPARKPATRRRKAKTADTEAPTDGDPTPVDGE